MTPDDEVTGEYWVPEDLRPDFTHHQGFDNAMDDALRKIPDEWRGHDLNVRYSVHIKENPGSVDGYKAHLSDG
jgi:hypothetical protein